MIVPDDRDGDHSDARMNGRLGARCLVLSAVCALAVSCRAADSARRPARVRLAALPQGPSLMFVSVASDDTFKHVLLSPIAAPDKGAFVTPLVCERVYFAGNGGVCLVEARRPTCRSLSGRRCSTNASNGATAFRSQVFPAGCACLPMAAGRPPRCSRADTRTPSMASRRPRRSSISHREPSRCRTSAIHHSARWRRFSRGRLQLLGRDLRPRQRHVSQRHIVERRSTITW